MKLVLASVALALVGCSSSVALKDGQTWEDYGYEAAMRGAKVLEASKFEGNAFAEYHKGYKKGLGEFCSQDGEKVALSGGYYAGTCDEINPNFTKAYKAGVAKAEAMLANKD
ncbi:DUF2799 domain-containing protein [Vibrio sp. WXL103]|uniref:DUF2799 domain-containing protein n=1 Tax=unclassified Vibrio TaxID=2614977 RepID=UPI003EC6CD3A